MRPDTEWVRFDSAPQDRFRPTAPPIYQTSTFRQPSAVEHGEFDYTRSGNPTRRLLEQQLARLERGARAMAFSSGMAAIAAALSLVKSGDEIWAGSDIYGGTYRLLTQIVSPQGIPVHFVDTTDLDEVARRLEKPPRLVLVETPTNPRLRITDIEALAALVHDRRGLLAVDNSLLSPYLQQPLELGADLVIHSATKFLCGHSDVTAGVVVARQERLADPIAYYQNAAGTGLAPFEAWLLLRGMKTLAIRMDRQQSNAQRLARFLFEDSRIRRVYYPGIADHPGRSIHRRQARGNGGVLCFETGSVDFSRRLVEATRLFDITVSFGGVASSISLPAFMSHASIPSEIRERRQLPEDLVRVSAGIEHPDDLIDDLRQALHIAETETPTGGERPCRQHAYSHGK